MKKSAAAVDDGPGRNCPLAYRYSPAVFDCDPAFEAETLYVIGGLYGNVEALQAVLDMQRAEQTQGRTVKLIFNGDFNWFDIDAESFDRINQTVLNHAAILGNVEAEIATPHEGAGCGCAYPDDVPDAAVQRSNQILQRLSAQAAAHPDLMQRLAALPMQTTVAVGGQRIGIVHGDAHSLSGWSFAAERLRQVSAPENSGSRPNSPRPHEARPGEPTPGCFSAGMAQPGGVEDELAEVFRQAKVLAFCSSHTCLPVALDIDLTCGRRLVMNNGAAGMPNFQQTAYGLLTRISACAEQHRDSLYGFRLDGVCFDALPIRFDAAAWQRRFLRNWPEGSAAHTSYFKRITQGPEFDIRQALPACMAPMQTAQGARN